MFIRFLSLSTFHPVWILVNKINGPKIRRPEQQRVLSALKSPKDTAEPYIFNILY